MAVAKAFALKKKWLLIPLLGGIKNLFREIIGDGERKLQLKIAWYMIQFRK